MARDLRVPKGRKHRVDLIRYEQRRKVARSQGLGGDKVRSNRAARGLAAAVLLYDVAAVAILALPASALDCTARH
jgi:hypothetical protein